MSVTHGHKDTSKVHTTTPIEATAPGSIAAKALAVLRISFGLTFLWAFFDKLLALGFSTGASTNDAGEKTVDYFAKDAAWLNGGSPTEGFLKFGADGPFQSFYNNIGGTTWANTLFMLGLLGIGLSLTLGVGMRMGTAAGALMYVLMWTVVLPPENNPVLDDHLLGAISMVVLALYSAGNTWGLSRITAKMEIVKKHAFLR